MQVPKTVTTWLFVAHTLLHLDELKAGEKSWWCVDRRCNPGDKAFIYQPLKGIILHFEILEFLKQPEPFCNSFQMGTAEIRVLDVFAPPVSSKDLKVSAARNEGFIRRNFQGKAFAFTSEQSPAAILTLAKKLSDKRVSSTKVPKPSRVKKAVS